MKSKLGSAQILILMIIIIIFLITISIIILLYFQINKIVYPIKQDLFYIVQNSYLSIDKENLSMSNYKIDSEILKYKIEQLMINRYPNTKVILKSIKYDDINNKVNIEIILDIEPIVLKSNIKTIKLLIKDTIKLNEMEVE